MNLLFSFKGSIGRRKFALIFLLSMFIYACIALYFPEYSAIFFIAKLLIMIIILICYLSALVRRLHDIGYYGIDLLLILVPIYNIYIFVLLFLKKRNENL